MIQWMLAIWSLVPLPFLKPAWTSGNSRIIYCWSLAWRILSITLLVCEMSGYFLAMTISKLYGSAKTSLYWKNKLCWIRVFLSFTILIWEMNLIITTVIVNTLNITLIECNLHQGVPNDKATDWYQSMACLELSCTVGAEQQAREQSFIFIYSCSLSLALLLSSASCQISNDIRFS